jgi:glutamine synthetase
VDEHAAHEQVTTNLEHMHHECATARQEAEARMRPLFDAIDDFIRYHRQQLEAAGQ